MAATKRRSGQGSPAPDQASRPASPNPSPPKRRRGRQPRQQDRQPSPLAEGLPDQASRSASSKSSPTKKKRGRPVRQKDTQNSPTVEQLTMSDLLNKSKQTTEEWLHRPRTKQAYASHVKAGKAWLDDWATFSKNLHVERDQARNEEETPRPEENPTINPALADAFDKVGEHTPTALRLFTFFKCEQNGCKFSTAEGIRSAFKDYFEQ